MTLIQAAKELPEIQFLCAGSGPLEQHLQNIPNIKNVGFQRGEALAQLIREAKFTVYPSEWYENCPFSVMESQMYGTPVLGADIGGIPELIQPGKTGEMFRSGSVSELKQGILKMYTDSEKKTVDSKDVHFMTVDEYAEALELHYQQCIRGME